MAFSPAGKRKRGDSIGGGGERGNGCSRRTTCSVSRVTAGMLAAVLRASCSLFFLPHRITLHHHRTIVARDRRGDNKTAKDSASGVSSIAASMARYRGKHQKKKKRNISRRQQRFRMEGRFAALLARLRTGSLSRLRTPQPRRLLPFGHRERIFCSAAARVTALRNVLRHAVAAAQQLRRMVALARKTLRMRRIAHRATARTYAHTTRAHPRTPHRTWPSASLHCCPALSTAALSSSRARRWYMVLVGGSRGLHYSTSHSAVPMASLC